MTVSLALSSIPSSCPAGPRGGTRQANSRAMQFAAKMAASQTGRPPYPGGPPPSGQQAPYVRLHSMPKISFLTLSRCSQAKVSISHIQARHR